MLGDGATERALIPPLARHEGQRPVRGRSGSMTSPDATAVVKFARLVELPWLLFADADDKGREAAMRIDRDYEDGDEGHIVWVSGPPNIDRNEATEQMFIDHDPQACGVPTSRL